MSERQVNYQGITNARQARAQKEGGPEALLQQMEREVAEQDATVLEFDRKARIERAKAYLKAAGSTPAAADFTGCTRQAEAEWKSLGGTLPDLHVLEGDDVAAAVKVLCSITGEAVPAEVTARLTEKPKPVTFRNEKREDLRARLAREAAERRSASRANFIRLALEAGHSKATAEEWADMNEADEERYRLEAKADATCESLKHSTHFRTVP